MISVSVSHTFEAAHRLPQLGGKCRHLHGHSWSTEVTVTAQDLTKDGIVVDFHALKNPLREWIDTDLDHGAILGPEDPLVRPLRDAGCKVLTIASPNWWPTVENIALMIGQKAIDIVRGLYHPFPAEAHVSRVLVRETATNTAEWRPL